MTRSRITRLLIVALSCTLLVPTFGLDERPTPDQAAKLFNSGNEYEHGLDCRPPFNPEQSLQG